MGIFFSFLSPAIFGISNFVDKYLLEKFKISPVVITIYSGLVALLIGGLILLLTGFYPLDIKSLFIILTSGFLTSVYLLPYYKALSLDETSRVVPLFQFYPIFTIILSAIFFNENFSILQIVGSALIIAGGIIISIKKIEAKNFTIRKSFTYMMLSCIIFAVAQLLYKLGVEKIPFWNTLPYEGFGMGLGCMVIALQNNNLKKLKKEVKKFNRKIFITLSFNELVYLLARYTGYFALSQISLGIVSILAGLQPLFVLVFGIIISLWFPNTLKEIISVKNLTLKFFSISLILLGTFFVIYNFS